MMHQAKIFIKNLKTDFSHAFIKKKRDSTLIIAQKEQLIFHICEGCHGY